MNGNGNDVPRIFVADKLDDTGLSILRDAGFEVTYETGLSADALVSAIAGYDGLIVRSATTVSAAVISAGTKLRVIGRAGVGVDNIDVDAATHAGVLVENTPTGNITSAGEHALALLFGCARNLALADARMKAGDWPKKECTGVELSGRTLGIIGLGKVGSIVARTAQSLDMEVLVFDPYLTAQRAADLNVTKTELAEVLQRADFLSVHAPLTRETENLIGLGQLKQMKPTARLINAARGGIVNEQDLAVALNDGIIAGAAVDVFVNEPVESDSPLRSAANITLTPHLGASTAEAQARVAEDIARQFVEFFRDGTIRNAVNLSVTVNPRIAAYAQLADVLGQMAAQMVDDPVQVCRVGCYGNLAKEQTKELGLSVLKGLLTGSTDVPVTLVNSGVMAKARGIELVENKSENSPTYASLLLVTVSTATGEHTVGGVCFDGEEQRIVRIDEFLIDVKPSEYSLLMMYPDQPGMIGKFGTILGAADINIANMAVGRREKRGRAVVVLTLDDPVPADVLQQMRESAQIDELRAILLAM